MEILRVHLALVDYMDNDYPIQITALLCKQPTYSLFTFMRDTFPREISRKYLNFIHEL